MASGIVCFAFVCTAFMLVNADWGALGKTKGTIYRKSGEVRGEVNGALRRTLEQVGSSITDKKQKQCMESIAEGAFRDANKLIEQATNELISKIESDSSAISNIHSSMDAKYGKIQDEWLPAKIAEIRKCK